MAHPYFRPEKDFTGHTKRPPSGSLSFEPDALQADLCPDGVAGVKLAADFEDAFAKVSTLLENCDIRKMVYKNKRLSDAG